MRLQQIRKLLGEKALEFMDNQERVWLVRSFTGSGKTTSIIKALDEWGYRWIYCAPNHDVIKENLERSEIRNYNFVHLLGRSKCCMNEEAKRYERSGVDVKLFCNECQFKETECTYRRTIDAIYKSTPNIALVHAHITTFIKDFFASSGRNGNLSSYYDVLIVDELPINILLNQFNCSIGDISYLRECLMDIEANETLINILSEILNPGINYRRICELPLTTLNRGRLIKWIVDKLIFFNGRGLLSSGIPKLRIIDSLFSLYENMNTRLINKMLYKNNGTVYISYFDSNALNLPIKIIGMDGTAHKNVWEHILHRPINNFYQVDYQYENATQFNNGRYPISSWKLSESTPQYLCGVCDNISYKKRRKVLLVGTKAVNEKALKYLRQKNYEFGVFYNIRSFNKFYKNCDTVILLCEPNPPQEHIDVCVSLSGWDEEVWRLIYRDEEMLQSIGRLRQNIKVLPNGEEREKMEVIILSNTGVYSETDGPAKSDVVNDMLGGVVMKRSSLLPEASVTTIQDYLYCRRGSLDILPFLDDGKTRKEIIDKFNYPRSYMDNLLRDLEQCGYVRKEEKGLIRRTKKGDNALSPEEKIRRGWINASSICDGD